MPNSEMIIPILPVVKALKTQLLRLGFIHPAFESISICMNESTTEFWRETLSYIRPQMLLFIFSWCTVGGCLIVLFSK